MSKDYGRIKGNISTMIDQGAPESDIAAYLQEEGVSAEELRKAPNTPQPPASPSGAGGGWNPTVKVVKDGRKAALGVYPGLRITQVERDPDSPLGRKNPKSWHNHTAGAVDADANSLPKGMTFEQYVDGFRKAGYPIVHAKNEDETRGGKRAPHATGDHWHVVLGPRENEPEEVADIPNPVESPAPEADAAGEPIDVTDDVPFPKAPEGPKEGFLEGVGHSILDTASGISEGWDGFQNDVTGLGLRATDALGLTDGSLAKFDRARKEAEAPNQDARYFNPEGWSRSVGWGAGNLAASAPLAAAKPLAALGQTGRGAQLADMSIQGGLFGAASSGGHDIAAHTAVGAVAAPVIGVAADNLIGQIPSIKATRFAEKEAARNPEYAAFDAEVVKDLVAASKDRAVSATDPKGRATLTAKTINSVEQGYFASFKALLAKSDMHPIEKEKLRAALTGKFAMGADEVAALRGTPQGDAVADAITKVQRLRALTPEVAPSKSKLSGAVDVAAGAMDAAPLVGLPGTFGGATAALNITRRIAKGRGGMEAARVNAADKLLAKQRGYEKLGEMVGPSGADASKQGLWDAATTFVDDKLAATTKAQAARQTKANNAALAKQAAMKLKDANERVGVNNLRDNIVPQDGFRSTVHAKTGLKPAEQDAGVLNALWQGKIAPEQFTAFLKNPADLMPGNAGNSMIDRLASMADNGKLPRDPNWKPPQEASVAAAAPNAAMVDAQGLPIRSKPAYDAGVQKNIAREMPLLNELDQIEMQKVAKYDSDPEYRKIAGTSADPFVQRILQLRSALDAMKTK